MRKVAAVILALALAACNEGTMFTGPDVQSTHDLPGGTVAEYVGTVGLIEAEQFVLYPGSQAGFVRLEGHEEQLSQLVDREAWVKGLLGADGVLHVQQCHGVEGP